ncbi:MAG: methyl-accepting chemotaxis protein [Xanthobacteraceae bacterium]
MNLLRLGLKPRLFGGFGVLVLLGLALAGYGAWQLSSVGSQAGTTNRLADNMTRLVDLRGKLEMMRRVALRMTTVVDDMAIKEGTAAEQDAAGLLDGALKVSARDDRSRTYTSIAAGVASFRSKRESLIALARQAQVDRQHLFAGGDELTAATGKLVEAGHAEATRTGTSQPYAGSVNGIESAVLLVRIANWRFLATADPKGTATFATNADKASAAISALEKMELPGVVGAAITPVKAALAAYIVSFQSAAANIIKISNLYEKEMRPQIIDMSAAADAAVASLRSESDAVRKQTEETIAASISTHEIVAGLALLIGGLIAFLVARSIIRPVSAMTGAMEKLAGGDTTVEIPSRDSSDEIGAMASAVEVFRQNALERVRLESAQAETERRTVDARKAEMHRLAASFEAAVGNIVNSVSSASTELEAAATTLTQTAATTQELSTVVAGASEEAAANVQAVASATEELTSSVSEISRQVGESSRIANDAVSQAQQTDARINELSQAASRIGEVVKLITAIAEQTNLLALNATIEAARAGEAGRGFAVVAQEVKALAAQTAKATDEISTQIAGMQTATQASVGAIKDIGTTIARISDIATAIASSVGQQGAATEEIARNVQQAASGTTQVAANIVEVNKGAGETGSSSRQVLASARALSGEGSRLRSEVDKFLLTVRAG